MRNLFDYPRRDRFLIILGTALVCLGAVGLLNGYAAISWCNFLLSGIIRIIRGLLPFSLIALGVLVVWALKTGRLNNVFRTSAGTPLHRSLYDRRILGVCGGIAQSRGVDGVLVRLIAVLLLVAFPLLTTIAYFLLAIIMQPE